MIGPAKYFICIVLFREKGGIEAGKKAAACVKFMIVRAVLGFRDTGEDLLVVLEVQEDVS